jgi:lipoprotein-releasing system permease protein
VRNKNIFTTFTTNYKILNIEFFIAKRLTNKKNFKNSFSRPIVSVATAGIAIGLVVMLVAVAVVTGFKETISGKVTGFGAHLQVVNFDSNESYETFPISKNQDWIEIINNKKGIKSVNQYIQKAGIIKTDEYLNGVIFKGVDTDYNWNFFKQYLVEGDTIAISSSTRTNNVLMSQHIANSLKLKLGDSFAAYFIQDPPRMRKFTVAGIYNTQLEDMDKFFVLVDIKHLRRLNDWKEDQITGFEIFVEDFSKIDEYKNYVNNIAGNSFSEDGSLLKVKSITEEYSGIFDWLSLLDMNVWVILILMVIVAGINMISGLLVIILERVNMIGVLKSVGATNIQVEKVFIYFSGFLIFKGLFWGNIIGIALCVIQHYMGIIHLDPSSYFVSTVPINLNVLYILLLNIGALIITVAMMIIPSMIISKINPSDSIRFN